MVNKRWLLVLSGLLWSFASSKILGKGIPAIVSEHGIVVVLVALAILGFFLMMFSKVSASYTDRIRNLEGERFPAYRFMSLKGYLIIGFMMSMGIGLGLIPGMPQYVFASLYPGLGLGLLSGALRFFYSAAFDKTVR